MPGQTLVHILDRGTLPLLDQRSILLSKNLEIFYLYVLFHVNDGCTKLHEPLPESNRTEVKLKNDPC